MHDCAIGQMPSAPQLLIVQPWFGAPGHPAQSLINTARAIGRSEAISYLVACDRGDDPRLTALRTVAGSVATFQSHGSSIRRGTWRALRSLSARKAGEPKTRRVLFFDGHLALIALLWPLLRRRIGLDWFGVLYLGGPERIAGNPILRWRMRRFLAYPEVRLFLRTDELANAWRDRFPQHREGAIAVLPSLEIPDPVEVPAAPAKPDGPLRLGVVGQIRKGKGLEWLVPEFLRQPAVGTLTVAGDFGDDRARRQFGFLLAYPYYRGGFLSEQELLEVARSQDYLLLLYDEWDDRMEAATLYLAARVVRPVICYQGGWLERMVRLYGCGVVLRSDRKAVLASLAALPRRGDQGYADLQRGAMRLREEHSASALRGRHLQALLGNTGHVS